MKNNIRNPLYFIAVLPPAPIENEIKQIKEKIKVNHDVKHALKLPAHITIQIPFRIAEQHEKFLIKKLTAFSNMISSFKVELDGFGRFNKNVIFIKVRDHQPLIHLHSELQKVMLAFADLKSHEITSSIHPHITIAVRDLKRSNFLPIWDQFENREYHNSFVADKLVLLKHDGKTWDIVKELKISN